MATQDQILASYAITHSEETTATALGIPRWQVRRARGTAKTAKDRREQHLNSDTLQEEGGMLAFDEIAIPGNGGAPAQPILAVPDANAFVCGDWHSPYHNRLMFQRMIYLKERHYPHIPRLIVPGDLFNYEALSNYPADAEQQDPEEEAEITGALLFMVLSHFKEVYICSGNHDERFGKKLNKRYSLKRQIYGALEGRTVECEIHVTDLDYINVNHPDDLRREWRIGHPNCYSGTPAKTPADMAQLYQRNVMTGHNHLVGQAQTKDGRFQGIDIGHMTDAGRHYYKRRRMAKYSEWCAGFAVLEDGWASVFSERFTNWGKLGC